MSLYPLLRAGLFQLDPERAHALGLRAIAAMGRVPTQPAPPGQPVSLFGLSFANRIGVAAGFDKNAIAVDGWFALGFGHVEVGTVTPRPQPGNPRPRLFRIVEREALVNRLGFPNEGAAAVVARLRGRRLRGVVGVNIGKNFDTPLERAADDYLECLRLVHDVADYVTVNVSSPNTAGLRSLQASAQLRPLLEALRAEERRLTAQTAARSSSSALAAGPRPQRPPSERRALPLLVKLAPDLDEPALREIAALLASVPVDGVIATNTTLSRASVEGLPHATEQGGLSGAPLRDRAREVVRTLRSALGPEFPIIGVGGVGSASDAHAMQQAGADLVQVYTGLVYRGPGIVASLAEALDAERPRHA